MPRAVFNQQFGEEALYEDALNALLPAAYQAAVAELSLDVVSSRIKIFGSLTKIRAIVNS